MVHEAWHAIQGAFRQGTDEQDVGTLVRERKREVNIKRGVEATRGYLSKLAAWLGGEYASEEADLSVVLGWLYEAGNSYFKHKVCEFQELVYRKQEVYGLPLLAERERRNWYDTSTSEGKTSFSSGSDIH